MTSAGNSRRVQLNGIRVLLAEDNQVNRLVAKAILDKAGATVIVAGNGLEAIERLEQDRPIDVVLMDVQMPELDGIGATLRIRRIRGLEHLPIVAMTAQAAPEERDQCLAAGMNAHVPKPIDADHLLSVVAALVFPRWAPGAVPESAEPVAVESGLVADRHATLTFGTTPARSPALPGVDVEAARRRLGGREDLLLDLLRSFAADATAMAALLQRAIEENHVEEARRLVHMLKGEAGNVSAEEVFSSARRIDRALRDGDSLTATELMTSLEREIARIADGLPPPPVAAVSSVVQYGPGPAAGPIARAGDGASPAPLMTSICPPTVAPAVPVHEASSDQERATVLIVDDSHLNTQALAAILADMCHVIVGTNGYEALSLAASHRPDLILLDVMMPGMDGYQVCSRLKGDPSTVSTPVIFVTAMDDEHDEARGLEAGAIDYLTKPLKAPIVRARVRNHLELKRYRDLLENLSIRDALTGIGNRRRLDEVLNHEWRRALRSPVPLSFILMDIDCFKAYNDHYGHGAGDECLRRVARALASATRRFTDLVARYGGEEFACVLPVTDGTGAAILGNRLRAVVEALNIPHAHSPVSDRVTISVGVASIVPMTTATQSVLTENADRHLYEAKRAGRNRVVTD